MKPKISSMPFAQTTVDGLSIATFSSRRSVSVERSAVSTGSDRRLLSLRSKNVRLVSCPIAADM